MNGSPIIVMLLIWLLIGLPIMLAKKAAEQQKKTARPAAQQNPEAEQATRPVPKKQAATERLTTLTPTIAPTGHDDSIYQGSLNAVTGEGYDPCHDEQMAPLNAAAQADSMPAPVQTQPGLPFGWTGSDMVKGIVMSEILKRKH